MQSANAAGTHSYTGGNEKSKYFSFMRKDGG